jgi:hypothetical protein
LISKIIAKAKQKVSEDGVLYMVWDFVFPMVLQNHLTPILLLIMGSSGLLTGWIVQERVMQVSGIVMNISGMEAFMVSWNWQPLQMSITNFVCVFLT